MLRFYVLILLFSVLTKNAFCQSDRTGTWGLFSISLPANMDHRIGGFFESTVRTERIFNKFFNDEFKTGLSYALAKNWGSQVGVGEFTTYDYNDLTKGPTTREPRIWEQVSYSHSLGNLRIEHRSRLEQRWVNDIYRNRLRYRLNTVLPLNHQKVQPKTFFASVYDEVFLTDKHPAFERNRISGALGYQFNPAVNFQAGVLRQYTNANGGVNKNNIVLNLSYQIQRKKQVRPQDISAPND